MRKLVPVVIVLAGALGGVGAGLALRPAPPEGEAPPPAPTPAVERDYVKLPNQFVVPILDRGQISALVVLSLSLEIPSGQSDAIYRQEPKLRDQFLAVLFEHANNGGFAGSFTAADQMSVLRRALLETARQVAGPDVTAVLITDFMRQDG